MPTGGKTKLLVILGPTAAGKSGLAFQLALDFGAEIVSADSLQVYKYLDIGTAKPSPEARAQVKHHLIDLIEPDKELNAGIYKCLADKAIDSISSSGKRVILVGGTFLYVRLLLHGLVEGIPGDRQIREKLRREASSIGVEAMYERLRTVDPLSALRIHPRDYVRVERALEVFHLTGVPLSRLQDAHGFRSHRYDFLKLALYVDRDELARRIDLRTQEMIDKGLVEEVRGILDMGYSPELKPLKSIGYSEIVSYLSGNVTLARSIELIKRNTKRYAKRQMTWLRKEGGVEWVSPEKDYSYIKSMVAGFFSSSSSS